MQNNQKALNTNLHITYNGNSYKEKTLPKLHETKKKKNCNKVAPAKFDNSTQLAQMTQREGFSITTVWVGHLQLSSIIVSPIKNSTYSAAWHNWWHPRTDQCTQHKQVFPSCYHIHFKFILTSKLWCD